MKYFSLRVLPGSSAVEGLRAACTSAALGAGPKTWPQGALATRSVGYAEQPVVLLTIVGAG